MRKYTSKALSTFMALLLLIVFNGTNISLALTKEIESTNIVYDQQVLGKILTTVREQVEKGVTPTIILDIDDTLLNSHAKDETGFMLYRPYPYAVEYANLLHDAGAQIVYLSSRLLSHYQLTLENLMKYNFPVEKKTRLILSRGNLGSRDFKFQVISELKKTLKIIACFDNEPENVEMMRRALPEAFVVFVDTRYQGNGSALVSQVYGIKDFAVR